MMVKAIMDGGIPAVYDEKRALLNTSLGDEHYVPNPSGFWEIGPQKQVEPGYMESLKHGYVYNVKFGGLPYLPDSCRAVMMIRNPIEIRSFVFCAGWYEAGR